MKLVISPAKSLDFKSKLPTEVFSIPHFLDKSKMINQALKDLSPSELSKLMEISDKLAQLNWQRNQDRCFNTENISETSRQDIYAFNGDVYSGLDAYSISKDKYEILNNKVRILSGLYGILKPFDLIEPYRLEMGKKLKVNTFENLYQIWKPLIAEFLNKEMSSEDILVNLASTEYFSAVDTKKVNAKIVTPEFKDYKDGKLKIISFYAKKARGLMARYIIDNNAQTINDLKLFNSEGYAYDEQLSTEDNLIFTR